MIEDDVAEALYQELKQKNLITHQFAGGTIGNTMHNYSVLADDRSVLLGVMCSNIEIGSYAYRYLCNTSVPTTSARISSRPILTIYKAWMARLVVALR